MTSLQNECDAGASVHLKTSILESVRAQVTHVHLVLCDEAGRYQVVTAAFVVYLSLTGVDERYHAVRSSGRVPRPPRNHSLAQQCGHGGGLT